MRAHQAEVQELADLSGGTREASTLGYELSADYVAGLLEAAGYDVTRQPFEYNFYQELADGGGQPSPSVSSARTATRKPRKSAWICLSSNSLSRSRADIGRSIHS